MADWLGPLLDREGLPASYRDIAERWWRPLAGRIAQDGRGKLIGVNGPQGSGKSTLCLFLEEYLRCDHGLRVATLSLDDLYLPHAARRKLAADAHPLFATRGVPGTHDVPLGHAVIDRALAGQGAVALPRFDKSVDDRAPETVWPIVAAPLDILLFEGWCVGARPQAAFDLDASVNTLEAEEDRDGIWRRTVNAGLERDYAGLFDRIDRLVMLKPPGFAQVAQWRMLQERKLIARTGRGMSDAEVARFIMHYERLTRHMLATLPALADIVVDIDSDHTPVAMSGTSSGQ